MTYFLAVIKYHIKLSIHYVMVTTSYFKEMTYYFEILIHTLDFMDITRKILYSKGLTAFKYFILQTLLYKNTLLLLYNNTFFYSLDLTVSNALFMSLIS